MVDQAEEAKDRERCHQLARSLELRDVQKATTEGLGFLQHPQRR